MRFTTAFQVAAVLAFTDSVFAAPAGAPANGNDRSGDVRPAVERTPEQLAELVTKLRTVPSAADRYNLLDNDADFVFDFNKKQDNPGKGGELIAANAKTFPALVGNNAGMALGRVGACGMNTLHVHPRASELQIVTKGKLITQMIPENGVFNKDGKTQRIIKTTLEKGQMTVFPAGSLHLQANLDCEDAEFVAAFNSDDFGTGQIANEISLLSDDVFAATFGQSIKGEDIDKVRNAIPKSIAEGVDECLKKCKANGTYGNQGSGQDRPEATQGRAGSEEEAGNDEEETTPRGQEATTGGNQPATPAGQGNGRAGQDDQEDQ